MRWLLIAVSEAEVNERGTGSAQYPPRLLLWLLVYSYAAGLFSSRQIERASHENVAVRLLGFRNFDFGLTNPLLTSYKLITIGASL